MISFLERLDRKVVASAFWWGEVEEELHRLGKIDYLFFKDGDREKCMEDIERIRRTGLYPHPPEDCTEDCKKRGKPFLPHKHIMISLFVDICTQTAHIYKEETTPKHMAVTFINKAVQAVNNVRKNRITSKRVIMHKGYSTSKCTGMAGLPVCVWGGAVF